MIEKLMTLDIFLEGAMIMIKNEYLISRDRHHELGCNSKKSIFYQSAGENSEFWIKIIATIVFKRHMYFKLRMMAILEFLQVFVHYTTPIWTKCAQFHAYPSFDILR